MDGYGVDINAPRKPFVTVTLLLRPFEWLWRPVVTIIWRVLANWLPFGGYGDDALSWVNDPAAFAMHDGEPYLRPLMQRVRV